MTVKFDLKLGEREGLLRFRLEKEYNRSCVEVGANHSLKRSKMQSSDDET